MAVDHVRRRVGPALGVTRRAGLAGMMAMLVLGCASCGTSNNRPPLAGAQTNLIHADPANGRTTITVGSKNFGEAFVLAEVYAQALRAAGYTVRTRLDLGSESAALRAVQDGRVSGYPEYTATALGSFFHVPSKEIPANAAAAHRLAAGYFARLGIVAFAPTPFADSNAIGMLTSTARRLGLKDISDLTGKSQDLVLAGSPECRIRTDCLAGLEKSYGLHFRQFRTVPIGQRYAALDRRMANLSVLFTSDAQLASLTRYTVLRDDRDVIPPGNVIFIASRKVVAAAGRDLGKTIEKVQGNLTLPVIQELNYLVDVRRLKPAVVARQYLRSLGYVR